MNLKTININTFRSIVNQTIEVNENCMAFIGLNESGKTNILNAIKYLNPKNKLSSNDSSKINDKDPSIEYHFEISKLQQEKLSQSINKIILNGNTAFGTEDIITNLNVKSVCYHNFYKAKDSSGKIEGEDELVVDYEIKINKNYKSLDKALYEKDSKFTFVLQLEDKDYDLEVNDLIQESLILETEKHYFKPALIDDVKNKISSEIRNYIQNILPSVHYWTYSPKYLIPSEITYQDFIEGGNPYAVNAPLYNMLLLPPDLGIYNTNDVLSKIELWKSDSSLRRKDSTILTNEVNKHIKSIWKDYDQDIKIVLEETSITIHVNDPKSSSLNYYDMNVRSQGFKTFISFILTISAEVETGVIENSVIILDEPETHLHPSGVKYMREELLKLSEQNQNFVFYATHSIFMIDRANLRRHIIVKKESELTKLIPVKRNNIIQEEVIYEALGTSVDEFSIANKNIVFEGELDLELFSYFIENCIYKKNNEILDYELHDGGGTKNIIKFFTNKTLPQKSNWTFILDNDSPGRTLSQNLEKGTLKEYFKTFRFKHYSKTIDFELEDILESKMVERAFNASINKEMAYKLNMGQEIPFSKKSNEFYGRNRITPNDQKIIEEQFKTNLHKETKKILDVISKEPNIPKKFELFIKSFPKYYDFIKSLDELKIIVPEK
tara:strand:- start:311 stop:2308 length:1998 start_codon:yes stop_codon:yes gene_type:complete